MAKSALKVSLAAMVAAAPKGFEIEEPKNGKGNSALKLVDAALLAAKTTIQSIEVLETKVIDACNAALAHAAKHGDAMVADRLFKGLMLLNHPSTSTMAAEVQAWFKQFSPIRWPNGAKGKVSVMKKTDEGFVDYDTAKAEETPFNATAAAKRARSAARLAHRDSIQEVTLERMLSRTDGVVNWLVGIKKGEVANTKIKAGELGKMEKFAKELKALVAKHTVEAED